MRCNGYSQSNQDPMRRRAVRSEQTGGEEIMSLVLCRVVLLSGRVISITCRSFADELGQQLVQLQPIVGGYGELAVLS